MQMAERAVVVGMCVSQFIPEKCIFHLFEDILNTVGSQNNLFTISPRLQHGVWSWVLYVIIRDIHKEDTLPRRFYFLGRWNHWWRCTWESKLERKRGVWWYYHIWAICIVLEYSSFQSLLEESGNRTCNIWKIAGYPIVEFKTIFKSQYWVLNIMLLFDLGEIPEHQKHQKKRSKLSSPTFSAMVEDMPLSKYAIIGEICNWILLCVAG